MPTVSDYFGSLVFNDSVMKSRLPRETYRSLKRPWTRAADWIPPSRT